MSQRIVTVCDVCDEPGLTYEVRWAGPPGHLSVEGSVDLCPKHAESVDDAIRPLSDAIREAAAVCPDCGRTFASALGVSQHRIKAHGAAGAATSGPPTYETDAAGRYVCPECQTAFGSPQAIGVHRARVHGYRKDYA